MREGKCGLYWKGRDGQFKLEGSFESVFEAHQAISVMERTKHLLARIHGDGGHHTEAVGIMQSIEDAEKRVIELRAELDEKLKEQQA